MVRRDPARYPGRGTDRPRVGGAPPRLAPHADVVSRPEGGAMTQLLDPTTSTPRAWDRAREVLIPTGPAERALLGVAAAFAVVGVAHVVPFLVEGGAWEGAVSWRKPIVFGVSIAIV